MDNIVSRLNNISEKAKEEFTEKFTEEYTRNAFGALSTKEIDLLVFKLFQQMGLIKKEDSYYDISRLLKISLTRVKSLSLETKLRDSKVNEKYILDEIMRSLIKSEFIQDNKFISFGIEDQLIRYDLEDRFKKMVLLSTILITKKYLK